MRFDKKGENMGKFKKIFLSKKAIALELVLALILAGVLWFFINKASHDFSQDPDMGLVNGTDSTMISTPIDGTKPSDHDPKQNAYYALYALNKASSFVTHCEGETITQVTFVSVSQKIKSMRVVNNGEMYKESISHSSFKGVGVRNYINGDNYVTLNADSVTSVDDVVWNSDAKKISKDDYVALYGYTPAGISGYILTDDTILSAEYLGEENGVFSYHYELDTVKSVAKLGLEMRTMAGTASLPIFEKASITIRVDENWNIISTTTNSVYAVDMLGGVTCTEEMTEVFSNLGDGVEIPNVEFFRDYLDDEVSEVGPTELTASDYLMQGFGEYITGDKPLKVALALTSNSADLPLSLNANALINIDINDLSNISAYIDVANLTYDSFTFNDIGIAYLDGDIYLNYKDIKAKANVNDAITKIEGLLPLFDAEMPSLNLGNIDLASLLESATVSKDGTNVAVNLPLSLAGIDLNATLYFVEDDGITFTGANATVMGLEINLTPDDDIVVDTTREGYSDLLSLLDVIDSNGKIALDVAIGDINAEVVITIKPFALDVKLGDITAKLSDNVIYVNYKDIKAKLAIDDIEGIIATLKPILEAHGVALPDMSGLANIDINAILTEVLDNLTTSTIEGGVKISTTVMDLPLDLVLSNANGEYTIASISTTVEDMAIVVEPTTDTFDAISNEALGNYSNIATLLDMIDDNYDIHLSVLFDGADIRVTFNVIDLTLTATYDGLEVYADLNTGDVYLTYPGVRATVNINDADYILEKLEPIIAKFMDTSVIKDLDLGAVTNIDFGAILDTLTVTESEGKVVLGLDLNGVGVNVTLTTTNGMRLDSAVITMGDTDITAIVLDTPNVKPVFDFTLEYSDAKALVDEFSDILTSILYSDSLSVKVGGSIVSGNTQFTIVDSDITIANITTAPKATAYVVLEQKDLTTGTAFTHTVTLTYLDPSLVANDTVNVYFTYDNSLDNTSEKATKLEGTFKTTKAGETWDIIKEIYKLMPDIQKALDGILVPDENGYPTLPKFDFPVTELIKSISFKDGLLSGYLDTSVIIESLPELLGAEIRKVDNTLNVTIPTFTMADMSIGLGVDITVPETTTITDDKFSFDTTNASDFSSINELLLTLKNTATARSFHITGNLSAAIGSWEIASDAVSLDVKLDVTEDGLTFAKVVIDRKDTSILGIKSTWNDYGGTSTLYYDAENELIYVHVKSKTKWLSNTYSDTYYTYTVEEYTADLMPRIFELINLSSTIQDAINKEDTSSNSTTPATVENTLLGYAYDDAANKFSINLDLTALLTDIGALDLTITHTDDMKLSKLYAKVNMVNIINLTLNAELESQGVYQGVKEDLASVKSQFPTK